MAGLRMFASMVLIDGAVLFVVYGLIKVFGTAQGGITSFVPAAAMIAVGLLLRPRRRTTRPMPVEPAPAPKPEPEVGRYR